MSLDVNEIAKNIRDNIQSGWAGYIPEKFTYRASTLPYCPRKSIYQKKPDWIELETIDKVEGFGAMNMGSAIHKFIQEEMKKLNDKWTFEEKIYLDFGSLAIQGHADIWTGEEVIDLKTIGDYAKKNIPYQAHLEQLAIYQIALNSNGALWYISRGNGEIIEVKQTWSEAVIKFLEILKKAFSLRVCEQAKLIPNVSEEYGPSFWECKYCEYEPTCFPENFNGRKKK